MGAHWWVGWIGQFGNDITVKAIHRKHTVTAHHEQCPVWRNRADGRAYIGNSVREHKASECISGTLVDNQRGRGAIRGNC